MLIKGYIGQVELKVLAVVGPTSCQSLSRSGSITFTLLSQKFDWDEEDRATREQQIKQALLEEQSCLQCTTSRGQSVDGTNPAAQDHRGGDSFIERPRPS